MSRMVEFRDRSVEPDTRLTLYKKSLARTLGSVVGSLLLAMSAEQHLSSRRIIFRIPVGAEDVKFQEHK